MTGSSVVAGAYLPGPALALGVGVAVAAVSDAFRTGTTSSEKAGVGLNSIFGIGVKVGVACASAWGVALAATFVAGLSAGRWFERTPATPLRPRSIMLLSKIV